MGELGIDFISVKHLKAAFLAMEPPNSCIALARQIGGGTLSTEVQSLILEDCICKAGIKYGSCNSTYMRNILKKVIATAEATSEYVVDGLYEQFAYYMSLNLEDDILNEKNRICKQISFLKPGGRGYSTVTSDPDLVVSLECSLNMLEGDTGCALWPSSLFLSEVILSYPDTFSNKVCIELGSGVGLVGVSLMHIGASKVILTDGDESSLANMRHNLERNKTKLAMQTHVECERLEWESPSIELQSHKSDIILGADIIYDPQCLPHLISVMSILLSKKHGSGDQHCDSEGKPIAFIAQVIRNRETFDYFLKLAKEAHISVDDITESMKPQNFLPYMLSYIRSSVRLFKLHKSSPS